MLISACGTVALSARAYQKNVFFKIAYGVVACCWPTIVTGATKSTPARLRQMIMRLSRFPRPRALALADAVLYALRDKPIG